MEYKCAAARQAVKSSTRVDAADKFYARIDFSVSAADLTREDWLGLLLDREVTARDNKRLGWDTKPAGRASRCFIGARRGLFAELATARGEGRLPRMLATLERTRLLIIDDWGPEPLTAEQRRDMLEIVEDRYEKGSLLMTSQIPVKRWHELIADPTIGDAIMDRVVHRAHRIELTGPSLRKRHTVDAPATGDSGAAAG